MKLFKKQKEIEERLKRIEDILDIKKDSYSALYNLHSYYSNLINRLEKKIDALYKYLKLGYIEKDIKIKENIVKKLKK
jgi:DNA polymerase sigma